MFECVIEVPDGKPPQTILGLNEVVVHAMPPRRMLDLELEVDGVAVSRFSGDGLIISSPIGSTAHNLSAGGPILGQELQAFVITPICPHTLDVSTHRRVGGEDLLDPALAGVGAGVGRRGRASGGPGDAASTAL